MVTPRLRAADDHPVLWMWIVGGLTVWLVAGLLVAMVIGRGIRLADERAPLSGPTGILTTADLSAVASSPARPALRVRRRAVPLPPIGIALVVMALALMTTGYYVRVTGTGGALAQSLSMDAPLSLPRMYVAALFAAAALAAVAGARSIPARRSWWLGVGLVAAGIAVVKAGSTLHADAMQALSGAVGDGTALLVSTLAAVGVLGALLFLSRGERRDRRRVLSALALYAVASVGLSALSGVAGSWYAAATYVEESGEALAGVAFLMTVLVGVAPRLVLPSAWALRRTADAHTLAVPEQVPGRSFAPGTPGH
jgi:hypothetical protein